MVVEAAWQGRRAAARRLTAQRPVRILGMAQTLSDSELVARCRSGDQQAWAELVDRFSRYVYAISVQAFRLPEADAEDVFQEVFARAYEHLDGLRDDAAVRPWLGQLTRRLFIDRQPHLPVPGATP